MYLISNVEHGAQYIGSSTRDLSLRFRQHKRDVNWFLSFTLYKEMTEFEIQDFNILLLKQLEVDCIQVLRRVEGYFIKCIRPSLNSNIAGRTMREYQVDNYEQLKNVDRIIYYRKSRFDNYNTLRQYRITYYENENINSTELL